MAYLLKDTEDEKAARRRRQTGGEGSERCTGLLRSVFTALHGASSAAPRPLSSTSSYARGGTGHLSSSSQDTTSWKTSAAAGKARHRGSEGSPLSSVAPSLPPASLQRTRSQVDAQQSEAAAGTSDAELYRSAIDYADILSIIQSPTQPPSRHGFSVAPDGESVLQDLVPTTSTTSTVRQPHATTTAAAVSAAENDKGLLFRRIAEDAESGVEVYSAPVKDFPIHLMRATAIMPCSPSELLQYMDNDIRPQWDTYVKESRIVRELPPHLDPAHPASSSSSSASRQTSMSTSIHVRGPLNAKPRQTSLAAESRRREEEREASRGAAGKVGSTPSSPASPPSTSHPSSLHTLPPSLFTYDKPFAFLPGQRRVALHYLGVRSPIMFVQDRDFELVVSESILPDGTAVMKAFSAPRGAGMPLDPAQSRYVRAVVVLSGIFSRPLRIPTAPAQRATAERMVHALPPSLRARARAQLAACDRKRQRAATPAVVVGATNGSKGSRQRPRGAADGEVEREAAEEPETELQYCLLEYFGLVHPLGLIPPQIVNVVISAQTATLRKLQAFTAVHPLPSLRPTPVPVPAWRAAKDRERQRAATPSENGPRMEEEARGGDAEEQEDAWWKRAKRRVLAKL